MRYVASIHGDNEPGFGIGFPDFPGCVSDGGTVEEAIRRGREALAFHIESMAEDGEDIPRPRARSEIEADPDMAEWLQGARRIVCVDVDDAPPPAIAPAADPLVRRVGEIFGRRLAQFVVCCGAVAQGIFERTHVRDGVRIAYAPHPSRGGWGQKKNIECMRGVYDGIAHAIR